MASLRLWLKRRMPRSLFARVMLILLLPVVLAQTVATVIFYNRHWDNLNNRLAFGVAAEIALAVEIIEEKPSEGTMAVWERMEQMARHTQLGFRLMPDDDLPLKSATRGMINAPLNAMLNGALDIAVHPFVIIDRGSERLREVRVRTTQGVLGVVIPERRLSSPTARVFLAWMTGSALLFLGVAMLFMRNQIRPILRLAKVAEGFGKGRDPERLKPEGALEVRAVTQAFLVMRERIQRQVRQRTEMLAGVSHDLRTPLTRMKLQLAMAPRKDSWTQDLLADVAEMEKMVEGYLAFARGEAGEQAIDTDIVALLEAIVERARQTSGKDVSLAASAGTCLMVLRPQAIRRCLENLVNNAVRYGTTVRLALDETPQAVFIHIDDDGAGIPEDKREEVLRPFVRLEGSRNPDTGGVGLGLTIASDIAKGHGGDLILCTSPLGGLRASVRLPK